MGLFSDPSDIERKQKLKALEDKREAFAKSLSERSFRPERMLFAQLQNGGFVAFCNFEGRQWLIVAPAFGSDEEFIIESSPRFPLRREEVRVQSEGMGGIFGLGKKGERGTEYVFTLADGSEVRMPFVFGRNGWGEFPLKKNPLLDTRRRRGDANIVWELRPIDNNALVNVLETADRYFGL